MIYTIVKGNENKKFELVKKHGVWALHFKRRLKTADTFNLIIHGIMQNITSTAGENDIYDKPLTLKLRIIVEE